jgi:hypothetical protein
MENIPPKGTIAVCKRSGTKYYHLYKEIMDYTAGLSDNPSFSMRFYCWENKIKEYPTCLCGCGTLLKTPWKFKTILGHANKMEETKNRKVSSYLAKYGVDNPSKLEATIQKREETCLEKFGVRYASQSVDIQNTLKEKWLEKYGVDNPAKTDDIRKRISDGVKPSRSLIRDIVQKKNFETFYKKLKSSDRIIGIEPMFSMEVYNGVDKKYPFKCKKCNNRTNYTTN